MNDLRRLLPAVDQVLADPSLDDALTHLGRGFVKAQVRTVLEEFRRSLQGHPGPTPSAAEVAAEVLADLPEAPTTLRPVINATGVIVHTNLGRAPLSGAAARALVQAADATDVELDLGTGKRAPRGTAAIAALEHAVPGAHAHVVNNGAAAITLACYTMAAGGNIILSRGEMVEIGDGFRIPELIRATGVEIREVGTTNRTHLRDYTEAIDGRTGFVLKIHPSNFMVEGFSGGVSITELSAHVHVPIVADIGSGLLAPHPRLPDEPDARSALRDGASLVIASGDKLLGGPQAGLLLGQAELIQRLRRHPLARALRVDKLTLAALEATLLGPAPPVARALSTTADELHERATRIAGNLVRRAEVRFCDGAVGGGGAPGVTIPSACLVLPADLAHALRTGNPAVMGRVSGGELLLDLLAVDPSVDDAIITAVNTALGDASA